MAEEESSATKESGASAPIVNDTRGWEGVRELNPAVLRSRLDAREPLVLIDVREPWEWSAVHLDAARHMPLATFARAAETLDRSSEIVVYCHHGVRSLAAARYLADRGFTRLWNLSGGIERYAVEGDPSLPRY